MKVTTRLAMLSLAMALAARLRQRSCPQRTSLPFNTALMKWRVTYQRRTIPRGRATSLRMPHSCSRTRPLFWSRRDSEMRKLAHRSPA